METKINSGNYINYIMDYEDGELSDETTIELFQFLLTSGIINSLQGHYGRTANDLLRAKLIK